MRKFIFFISFFLLSFHAWAVDYAEIDKYAYSAPILQKPSKLQRVVRYLVSPYKKDEEKARSILAWIVHNIDYDAYKFNAIEDELDKTKRKNKELFIPDNDILETRLGVCGDIAELYKKMGDMAGLNVIVILGKTKNEDTTLAEFEDGTTNHAWNAVKINREWEYVDPTWAIGGDNVQSLGDIEKKREYEKIVRQREKRSSDAKAPREGRKVIDQWFLTDKEEMIKTHFPNDERWRLQKKKITKKEFLDLTDNKAYRAARKEMREKHKENIR